MERQASSAKETKSRSQEMKVELDEKKAERIEKYVTEKKFKSVEEFVDRAVTLLLYAEDNRGMFEGIIKQRSEGQDKA